MTRTETSIKKVGGVDPNYLKKYVEDDKSRAEMEEYRILPRHKIIQAVSKQELIDEFGVGTIIINPGGAVLWKRDDPPFGFVPVAFFTEYCKFSDRRDPDNPMIMERTYDKTSEIAKRSMNLDRRFETYEGHEGRPEKDQHKFRYVRHFRFVGVVWDKLHPLNKTPFTLSFEKGEDRTGEAFISAILMRYVTVEEDGEPVQYPVPLYAQVWELKGGLREVKENKWWGVDFFTPENSLLNEEDAAEMKALHEDMTKMKEADRLIIDEIAEEEIEVVAQSDDL